MLEKWKSLCEKKPLPWYAITAVDILITGLVLVIFALFHHVIPHAGRPLGSTMGTVQTPAPTYTMSTVQPYGTADVMPSSAATPAPTYAVGDFTGTFPNYDTGVGAIYSYQSDDLKVAITKGYGTNSAYLVADVWVRNIKNFGTAFAGDRYGTGITEWPLQTANSVNAVFAVTGDYYGARNEGLVIRNGTLYRSSLTGDTCVIYADGSMETHESGNLNLDEAVKRGIWQGWNFGPELLRDGKAITDFTSPLRGENPRCSMGYYEPGHYCFIVVDGRQEGYSDGMTLEELSAIYAAKGCKTAYNLDGGQTATMIFQGQIINSPCEGGRRSSDIICFFGGAQ
ncbi:MAG: phosphodiester glycosidase family protein [Clostridia bacterium]|nr:phosphodiester glycosidase family protein [Clostridia bacterium]